MIIFTGTGIGIEGSCLSEKIMRGAVLLMGQFG